MSPGEKYDASETIHAQPFPIGRSKMYLAFAIVNFFAAFPRYFLGESRGIIFHGSLYLGTLVWSILSWEFILYTGKLLEKRLPAESYFLARITIQTVLTFPVVTLLGEAMHLSASYAFNIPMDPRLVFIGYLFYFLMTLVLTMIHFGTLYFFRWKKDLIRLGGAQREQAMVRYDGLRNQLNPHFLFNALTSLNSLIFENQQLASDFLQQLAKVFRYTLQNKENETVSLRTELEFIYHYIQLLKTRFASAIEIDIHVREDLMDKGIVPVTSQLLIENAVKHNIISQTNPLKIFITANDIFFIVQNNTNRKEQVESSNKQGLENLRALYQYLSDIPVEIDETDNSYTVRIPLL